MNHSNHLALWPAQMPVYLHRAPVDFRKQINGLAVLVTESMQLDAFKPGLFVFTNGARNRVKVLYWDSQGFCLWLKRLEKHRFVWPPTLKSEHEGEIIALTGEQLNWLIGGYDIFRFAPHEALKFDAIT
jgi:transposase